MSHLHASFTFHNNNLVMGILAIKKLFENRCNKYFVKFKYPDPYLKQ